MSAQKSLKNFLFPLAVSLFCISYSFSGTVTFLEAKNNLLQDMDDSKATPLKVTMKYLTKYGVTDFTSYQEWKSFIAFCDSNSRVYGEKINSEVCFYLGLNCSQNGYSYLAYNYYMKVEEFIVKNKSTTVSYYHDYNESIGLLYYNFGRNELAKKHFERLIKSTKTTDLIRLRAYNVLGLICNRKGNIEQAKSNFYNALLIARKNNIEEWIGVLSGNLGEYYFKKKNYVKANDLMLIDFNISCKTKQWESAINALVYRAEIDIKNQHIQNAKDKLDTVECLINHHYCGLEVKANFHKALSNLGRLRDDFKAAYVNQSKYIQLMDSVQKIKNIANFQNMEFQFSFQKKQNELKLMEAKRKKTEQFFIITTIASFILFIGLIVYIRQIVIRKRKEKEILVLQNLRVEDELKNIEENMRIVLSNLKEKNELVNHLQNDLETLTIHNESKLSIEETQVISDRLQSFKLLTEEDWDEFRKLFEKRFPNFFTRFNALRGDLTKADFRLAALIRLDHSPQEIGRVLGISTDSVKKTHLRLRKKMNLEQPKELDDLIKTL